MTDAPDVQALIAEARDAAFTENRELYDRLADALESQGQNWSDAYAMLEMERDVLKEENAALRADKVRLEGDPTQDLTPQEMVELMALVIMAGPNVPRPIAPIMRKMGDIIRRSEIEP